MTDDIDRLLQRAGVASGMSDLIADPPPVAVDEKLIRDYYAGTLKPHLNDRVSFLIASYRTWWDANRRVCAALAAESAAAPSVSPAPAGDVLKKIGDYLGRTADALLAEMMRLVPGDLAGARSAGAIAPYLNDLRRLICQEWNWPQRRLDPELQDPTACAEALRELIASSSLRLPFPPELVAAYLVKEGLDRLCD